MECRSASAPSPAARCFLLSTFPRAAQQRAVSIGSGRYLLTIRRSRSGKKKKNPEMKAIVSLSQCLETQTFLYRECIQSLFMLLESP